MRSAIGPTAFEDLTARARIRDTALRLFAERGPEGATLRAIAAEAGVSLGLIQHHFGSKEGLVAACDEHVIEALRRQVRGALEEGGAGDPTFLEAAFRGAQPVTRYVVRRLLDGSPAAATLFDEIVGLAEHSLPDDTDVRARAAVLAAMKMGVSVFEEHLVRVLGVRDMAVDGWPRITKAMLDIISPAAIGADLSADARAGLERLEEHRHD